MRKKILIILLVTLTICTVTVLAACNRHGANEEKSNICRETSSYLAGESEQFAVSVESGRREKVFIADGKATDVENFTGITITPLKKNDYDSISFVLQGGENSLTGSIDSGTYGEFSTTITLDFVPTTVVVTAGDDTSEIELSDILEGALSSGDAINIANEAFADKLEKEALDGKPEREIYVKIITGDRITYYYYVSFIGEGVDYWALLIDPKTGDIVSKK